MKKHTRSNVLGGDTALPAADSSFISRFGGTLKGKKARAALALAVSLWIANGGVASAAYVYIDVTDENTVKYEGSSNPVEPGIGTSGVTTLTASGDWGFAELRGGKGSIADTISGYTMIVAPAAKLDGVRGGWNTGTGNATGNTVIIGKGATIGGEGVSGGTVNVVSANATGNTVELRGATIGIVMGGRSGHVGNGDLVTGNTLILSGENTVNGYYGVQNFETIKLSDVLEWNAGQTVLNATSSDLQNFTNETSLTKMTLDISEAAKLKSAAPGTMTLLSSGKTDAFNGFKLKDFDSTEHTLDATGITVFNGEATNEKNGVTLAYDATHTVKLEDSNKKVTYNVAVDNPVKTVTLGEIAWDTSTAARTLTTEGLTFNGTTAIDASGLTFTGTVNTALKTDGTSKMTLLAGATGIMGDHITQPSEGKGTLAVNYTNDEKINFTAAASGEVTVTTNKVEYTINKVTLSGVNLAGWNGTASTVPTGWTAGTGLTVATDGMTAPTNLNPGDTATILTGGADFFAGATINGEYKWTAGGALGTTPVNGVSLTGTTTGGGVKADDTDKSKLIYQQLKNTVTGVTLGEMTWGTARDASGTAYDYAGVTDANLIVSGLTFANPEDVTGTTTLLAANDTLTAELADVAKPVSYQYNPVAGVTVEGAINGSVSKDGANIVYTATENKANKLTFGDVEWKDSGALLTRPANITFAGAAVDTTNINFTNIKSLDAGKKMTLVLDFGNSVGTITGTKYKVGTTLEGTGKASLSGSDLIFTAETGTSQEQTHNTVMGAEVGMAALSAGNDFVGAATEGLSLASNVGADGVSSFAQMGGGSMRQETGSHVDTHTWNAILALGHQNKKERGTFEYGAFFEYGSGNYSTFNGDERGDGSMHYTGGGLLAKWTANHGMYVEGSLRAGSVHDDARNVLRDGNGVPYSYETNAPYFGGHIGVGKEIAFDDIHSLDVYGKYFYNRRNGVSFDAGGHYDLDAVTSQVVRVGARYTVKRSKWSFYAGAAYEHELDGKAGGTADGREIRGADTSGGSLRGEIGATMKPGENSPITLDFNVTGFAGKKQGFSGGVSVAFMF